MLKKRSGAVLICLCSRSGNRSGDMSRKEDANKMDRWIFFQECSSEGWISLAADIVLVCLAVFSAATDLYRGKVYNAVTVPGLLAGLAFSVQRAGAPGILDVFCAVGFTGLVLFPFYKAGGLGAGDIKLLAALSFFLDGGCLRLHALRGLSALFRGFFCRRSGYRGYQTYLDKRRGAQSPLCPSGGGERTVSPGGILLRSV